MSLFGPLVSRSFSINCQKLIQVVKVPVAQVLPYKSEPRA